MARREFSARIKVEAYERSGGKCEGEDCGLPLTVGKFHYDHDIADALGGEPILENCKVLCVGCHSVKTRTHDVPKIAKTKRVRQKHLGIKKPKSRGGFQTNRDGKWKKPFNGNAVER